MAIGAITISSHVPIDDSGAEIIFCSFAGEDDYPTGGTEKADVDEALATALAAEVAAATDKNIRGVRVPTIVGVIPGDCGKYAPSWVDDCLFVRDGGHATRDELSLHDDVHGTTFNVGFVCK